MEESPYIYQEFKAAEDWNAIVLRYPNTGLTKRRENQHNSWKVERGLIIAKVVLLDGTDHPSKNTIDSG